MQTIDICRDLNIMPIENYQEFLNPDRILIPINDPSKLTINVPGQVLLGEIIYKDDAQNICSSISGIAKEFIKIGNQSCLEIINDYQENRVKRAARNLNRLDKETFLKSLNNARLVDVLSHTIDTLYINCIEDEPYFYNRYMFLLKEMDSVIEISKYLLNNFSINKIQLVIKNNYREILAKYVVTISEFNQIGIETVENIYPIGNLELLRHFLIHKESDSIIDLSDILYILYNIKKNISRAEKYITISGNAITKPTVFKVKKYSLLEDVLKLVDLPKQDVKYILNNSLCGEEINYKNILIDDSFKGLIINNINNDIPLECSKCGLCYNVCPININPLIKDEKCLKCGLCNYVCPAKIDIVKEIQK